VARSEVRLFVVVVLTTVLQLPRGGEVAAEELAILTVSYGEEVSPLLEATVRRAAAALGHTAIEVGVAAGRVAERYRPPEGIDRAWLFAEVERGEELYYAMSYAAAQEVFESPEWLAAQSAVVEMALDPAFSDAVRRGLMARGRAAFYAGDGEATEAAIRDAVVLFPEWIPPTEWYQPEYVVRYTEVRHDVLRGAAELRLSAPAGRCDFAVDGAPLGRGSDASSAIVRDVLAARVTCTGLESRVHVLGPGDAHLDPRFDEVFEPSLRAIRLSIESADDAGLQLAMGRAYADVVGVEWVILAGLLPSGELQLVDVRVGQESPRSAVRARPDRDGALDVPTAVTALLGGGRSTTVAVAAVDDRRLVFPRLEEGGSGGRSGPPVASWVAFGVAGAGLVMGTVFTLVEGSADADLEACYRDVTCFATGERESLEDDRESAALLATIGFGVAVVGIVTGVIVWALDSGDERHSASATGRSEGAGRGPAVEGGVLEGGGWLGMSWQF
jgi:hypothetical protein